MRRRQLKGLWARLKDLHRMSVNLKRDELLIKLGQAKAKWLTGWRLVEVEIDAKLAVFQLRPRSQQAATGPSARRTLSVAQQSDGKRPCHAVELLPATR